MARRPPPSRRLRRSADEAPTLGRPSFRLAVPPNGRTRHGGVARQIAHVRHLGVGEGGALQEAREGVEAPDGRLEPDLLRDVVLHVRLEQFDTSTEVPLGRQARIAYYVRREGV